MVRGRIRLTDSVRVRLRLRVRVRVRVRVTKKICMNFMKCFCVKRTLVSL